MSDDLIQRLRGYPVRLSLEAADRIEADEALMRQALEALEYAQEIDLAMTEAITALRARLGESK